jgi:hypothetical protein
VGGGQAPCERAGRRSSGRLGVGGRGEGAEHPPGAPALAAVAGPTGGGDGLAGELRDHLHGLLRRRADGADRELDPAVGPHPRAAEIDALAVGAIGQRPHQPQGDAIALGRRRS